MGVALLTKNPPSPPLQRGAKASPLLSKPSLFLSKIIFWTIFNKKRLHIFEGRLIKFGYSRIHNWPGGGFSFLRKEEEYVEI
jgi:hypothetical protein